RCGAQDIRDRRAPAPGGWGVCRLSSPRAASVAPLKEHRTMKYAVLGTGMVGNTIGARLVSLGHEVKMGSRSPDNPKAAAWAEKAGRGASQGTFADAAAFADVIFNCTAGGASLAALEAAGAGNLRGKILIDVANPLD